jgi:hypothetical protein
MATSDLTGSVENCRAKKLARFLGGTSKMRFTNPDIHFLAPVKHASRAAMAGSHGVPRLPPLVWNPAHGTRDAA